MKCQLVVRRDEEDAEKLLKKNPVLLEFFLHEECEETTLVKHTMNTNIVHGFDVY